MGGWGGAGFGPIFMIFWLLVIVALIAGVAWFMRSAPYQECWPIVEGPCDRPLSTSSNSATRAVKLTATNILKKRDMGR